jgi:hypothetical protein
MKINGIHMNDAGRPIDRFDLESAIMNAWRTSEDIKALYKSSEYMDEDQMLNALLGLEIFAEMRFNDLWNTFEKCISNGVFESRNSRVKDDWDTVTLTDLDTGDSMNVSMDFVLHEKP